MSGSFSNPMPPRLSEDKIHDFLLRYFPFAAVDLKSIKEFPSYVDRNYYFTANLHDTSSSSQEQFILKFLNSTDSSDLGVMDGLMQLMIFLHGEGINCPFPVPTPASHHYIMLTHSTLATYAASSSPDAVQLEKVITNPPLQYTPSSCEPHYCVYVLRFVEGHDVSVRHTPEFLYNLGTYIGNLDNKLKSFSQSGLESRDTFYWNLCHFYRLKERQALYVTDPNRRKIIDQVLDDFELHVAPLLKDPSVPKGLIHNDVNPNNIMVIDQQDDFTINGIIDVSDSVQAPYVFELAIAVSHYMNDMVQPVKYIKPLIDGYLAVFPLPQSTLDVLYYIVLARLAQLYVNGIHSSAINPTNLYITRFNESAWQLLQELVDIGKETCTIEWALK